MVQIIFISECYNYKQYWSLVNAIRHLQTLDGQMWLKGSQIK
jgi:hypothetical protein